jgi:hypothetical protein
MPKQLTDKQLAEIVHRAVHDESLIDCQDAYLHFVEDLADLIESHFGGEAGTVYFGPYDLFYLNFHVNDSVPADGGIYKDYDTDITWKDGEEV